LVGIVLPLLVVVTVGDDGSVPFKPLVRRHESSIARRGDLSKHSSYLLAHLSKPWSARRPGTACRAPPSARLWS
jgi:hypothetical protein